ncbi:hypothetical protein MWH25_08215 [Natroniella acetigena]|uniref:hypothetical protein n=1 Tax=Natroniella acetigena TaxID=52004 RepID=UPI00200B11C2|nr:hypothetical protein [Natroniella acetigena]MCK8827727.1 hypothetical protein [Natroniella acetigena]
MLIAVKNILLGFIASLVKSFLQSTANNLWGETWDIIFESIEEAEKEWDDGRVKKKYVMDKVMKHIEGQGRFGRIKKFIIKNFISSVIDALIREINQAVGSDWVEKAGVYERRLADRIEFID